MQGWNKIRMSDEEFIKGIYAKANQRQELEYEEKKNEENVVHIKQKRKHQSDIRWKWISFGLSTVACGAFVLKTMDIIPSISRGSKVNTGNAMYLTLEEEPLQAAKAVPDEAPEPDEVQPIMVKGTITGSDEVSMGSVLLVTVSEEDSNEIEPVVHVLLTEHLEEQLLNYQEEHDINTLVGKEVAMKLIKYNFRGYYKVDTNQSFYIKEYDDMNLPVYRNMEGDQLADESKN